MTSANGLISPDQDPTLRIDDWDRIAVYPIMVLFDLPGDIKFKTGDPDDLDFDENLNIGQRSKWFVNFLGTHKMWYTKKKQEHEDLPEYDSAPYAANKMKNVEVTSNGQGI